MHAALHAHTGRRRGSKRNVRLSARRRARRRDKVGDGQSTRLERTGRKERVGLDDEAVRRVGTKRTRQPQVVIVPDGLLRAPRVGDAQQVSVLNGADYDYRPPGPQRQFAYGK